MRQAIFAVLFFALTMVVMSAPTNHTMYKRDPKECARRNVNSKAPRVGGPPSNGKGTPRSPVNRKHSREPYERGPKTTNIKLCEFDFRSKSSRMCEDTKDAFVNGAWVAHPSDRSGLECDHPLELQLSRDALVQAGFCRALDAIKAVVYFAVENRGGKRSTVDTRLGQLMSNYDTLSPKLAANNLDMLYLVDAKFNGEKKVWTQNFLGGKARNDANVNKRMKDYFIQSVKTVVDRVATNTDDMAQKYIDKVLTYVDHDVGSETQRPEIKLTEEQQCELNGLKETMDAEVKKFRANKNAVENKWKAMKNVL